MEVMPEHQDPNESMKNALGIATGGDGKLPYRPFIDCMKEIRKEWGTQGTMDKIMKHLMSDPAPVTVKTLTDAGPVIPGYEVVVAAICFSSLAKLKEQGYISFVKDPRTLEITDVMLSIERFGTDHKPHELSEYDLFK